jgi:hypothetical protein
MPGPTRTQITRRETAAARRQCIIDEGGRALYVLLQREAREAQDRLQAATGEDATALVSRLLLQADVKLR